MYKHSACATSVPGMSKEYREPARYLGDGYTNFGALELSVFGVEEICFDAHCVQLISRAQRTSHIYFFMRMCTPYTSTVVFQFPDGYVGKPNVYALEGFNVCCCVCERSLSVVKNSDIGPRGIILRTSESRCVVAGRYV